MCSGYSTRVIQYKLATQFRNFCFTYILGAGNLVFKCHFICEDSSQVHLLNATWSGKLSDSHTTAIYVYYKEGIVGVDRASNQAVIQRFSRTSPGIDLDFQRPGFVLLDRTIVLLAKRGW